MGIWLGFMRGFVFTAGCVLASTLSAVPTFAESPSGPLESEVEDPTAAGSRYHGFYLLPFDRYGDLTSIYERDLAIEELRRNRRVETIFVVSYGWANDGESSHAAYLELLRSLGRYRERTSDPDQVAIFGVGWDSSQSGARKLLNDLLPVPFIADVLAVAPDTALFPLSFWSKAAMGDRIGYGGLRQTLNQVMTAAYGDVDPDSVPEIYLIGHSFGTRVISGLMQDRVGWLPVRSEPFEWAHQVRGAILFQPALVPENLHETADYPVLVTFSRHDHANGFLFPLANLAINAYAFSGVEALIERRVFDPAESVGREISRTGRRLFGRGPLPRSPGPQENPVASAGPSSASASRERSPGVPDELRKPSELRRSGELDSPRVRRDAGQFSNLSELPSRSFRATRRLSLELLSIPTSVLVSTVATPTAYAYTQVYGLATRPVGHLLDSLAQLPVAEVAVAGISRILKPDLPYGQRSKGVFELGGLNEAVGRLPASRLFGTELEVFSIEDLERSEQNSDCGLPRCAGVLLVDASNEIRRGAFGDLGRPWLDFTLGWLDPIGSHGDYASAILVRLAGRVVDRVAAGEPASTADTSPDVGANAR